MTAQDKIGDAIASATDSPMVTHWVVVAVTVEEDGAQCTALLKSPGLQL